MGLQIGFADLIEYTDWERGQWFAWFRKQGDGVLAVSAGPNGDGRFSTIGELVRHIFSAEIRYADRLSGRTLTDTSIIATDKIEALFEFSQRSRKALNEFVRTFPPAEWNVSQDQQIGTWFVRASPRKIVIHVVMHEIRHWAQIATLLRLRGLTVEPHDFLVSPLMGT